MYIEVVRPKDTVIVSVFKHKLEDKYSFINLTKGHICPCKFNNVDEALEDDFDFNTLTLHKFTEGQLKSLSRVSNMIKENGGKVFKDLDEIADYLNNL